MAKRPGRKRDIWFHGRWLGYMPVSVEGLILTFVVLPISLVLMLSGDWLAKQGFDAWVGTACEATGSVSCVVFVLLAITHTGFDSDL